LLTLAFSERCIGLLKLLVPERQELLRLNNSLGLSFDQPLPVADVVFKTTLRLIYPHVSVPNCYVSSVAACYAALNEAPHVPTPTYPVCRGWIRAYYLSVETDLLYLRLHYQRSVFNLVLSAIEVVNLLGYVVLGNFYVTLRGAHLLRLEITVAGVRPG
jgi:hypothetical protein